MLFSDANLVFMGFEGKKWYRKFHLPGQHYFIILTLPDTIIDFYDNC